MISAILVTKMKPCSGSVKTKKPLFKKWTLKENTKYAHFLMKFAKDMDSEAARRALHLFKIMAKGIYRRSAEQCRTHHQKMVKRYGSIENIVHNLLNTPQNGVTEEASGEVERNPRN